jgi:hypothetical protein
MQLSGRNQSHHSSRNFISRVFVGALKNPNQFHQDFSANKGGLLGAAVIDNVLRNFKLLRIILCQKSHKDICVESNRHGYDVAPSAIALSIASTDTDA